MYTVQQISITALMALVFGTATASARQLPQYEVTGFPISPVQMSVIKPSVIQEQPSTTTLTLDGMPASPHQIAVIGPRTTQHMSEKLNKDASDISAQTTN
jgi:hypothetical protein